MRWSSSPRLRASPGRCSTSTAARTWADGSALRRAGANDLRGELASRLPEATVSQLAPVPQRGLSPGTAALIPAARARYCSSGLLLCNDVSPRR